SAAAAAAGPYSARLRRGWAGTTTHRRESPPRTHPRHWRGREQALCCHPVGLSPLASTAASMERPERAKSSALDTADVGLRELLVVREIIQAFLTATRPGDVYQFALDRVSPLVGATFACVYLVDG